MHWMIRKAFSTVSFISFFFLLLHCNAAICDTNAQSLFDYQLVNEEIMITGYHGHEPVIHIPEQINGVNVTRIGESAFAGSDSIWRVIVPDTVYEIQDEAFLQSSIKEIILPINLRTLGDEVFAESELSSVYIPGKVTVIGRACFYACYQLTGVYIDGSIKSIPDYCFFECINLKTVHLNDSIEKIEENAFYYCPSLHTINIPQSLIFVDDGNFGDSKVFQQFSIYMQWDETEDEDNTAQNGGVYAKTARKAESS